MTSKLPKPNEIYPNSPTTSPSQMPLYIPDFSIRGESFDQILANRGVRFIHRIAAPCPNMKSITDNNHDPNCLVCGNHGFVYYREKEIFGVFASNSLEKNFEQQGVWEIGTAVVSLPTEYADGEQADFNTFDQLLIPDFEVRVWELLEFQPTPNDQQLLRYSIQNIDQIFSVINNQKVDYQEGVNFTIVDGAIQWIPGKTPPFFDSDDRGTVLSITYLANPIYNVLQHLRELRITQEFVGTTKVAKRLPQQILVKRDFITRLPDKET